MLKLSLAQGTAPLRILCLGAHSDDIEIGAGGTIRTLIERHPGTHVHWIVFSATEERAAEARDSANDLLTRVGSREIVIHNFRDGFFPSAFSGLKETFEAALAGFEPDLVFTHYRSDHHQDHRTIAELSWNTFRNHLILEYEIPKYDPDMGNPNVFVALTEDFARDKVSGLMRHFVSQRRRRWFNPSTFDGLMRLRGMQAAVASGLAEGFYARRLVL
jgi:LmbE family N-acetylglucosaminyl deacetylase